MKRRSLGLLFCGWCALSAADEVPFKVCVLSHNLPYSIQDSERGFDVDIARLVAAELKRNLTLVWISNPENIQEIEESDFPLPRLARGSCDAILSVPGPARDSLKGMPKLSLGEPYYGAAFELYGTENTASELHALRDQTVAIQAQTVASFALALLHIKQRTFFAPSPALESVASGDTAAALLWGPAAGWQLKRQPTLHLQIATHCTPPPALSWNLHVATRTVDAELRRGIDSALQTLANNGRLYKVAGQYGIPFHPPFKTTYSLTEMNKLK